MGNSLASWHTGASNAQDRCALKCRTRVAGVGLAARVNQSGGRARLTRHGRYLAKASKAVLQ